MIELFFLMATTNNIRFVLLQVLVSVFACRASVEPIISRISFGSCANQNDSQPIWHSVIDFNPQLFIWLGDNIYGDIRRPFRLFGKERTIGPWKNVPRFIPASEQEMQFRYRKAKRNPGYSFLRKTTQVIGTWDDHDYGLNDAGKEFSGKNTSQVLLLDFLDEPKNSPRRKQAGVYASYMFGPKGKQIKVILLDTRYHRDPLFSDGSILGRSQWIWLEKELNGPKSEVTIIGSSIQILQDAHFIPCSKITDPTHVAHVYFKEVVRLPAFRRVSLYTGMFDSLVIWFTQRPFHIHAINGAGYIKSFCGYRPPVLYGILGTFPKGEDPFVQVNSKYSGQEICLFLKNKRDGVFFISGDVHFGEITRYDCGAGYPLYDFTSSGLTQAVEKAIPPTLAFLVRFVAWLTPTTMRVIGPKCRYRSCTYGQPNFGAIEIDWDATPVTMKVQVMDINGNPVTGVNISLLELQNQARHHMATVKAGEYRRYCSLEINLPWVVRYRLSTIFFCALAVLLLALVMLSYAATLVSRRLVRKCKSD